MVIGALLAAGFTVISAATIAPGPGASTCAYATSRLPRTLGLLGSDTASVEETRAARKKLGLSESILTRASRLSIARALRASRLIIIRCTEDGAMTTIEAQPYDVERPLAEAPIHVSKPTSEVVAAIDELARKLAPEGKPSPFFRGPNARALNRASQALSRDSVSERAQGLIQSVEEDPSSIDLRLAAVEALIAARDFDAAIRLAGTRPEADTPPALLRALRFVGASAQLEAGRYSEAAEKFEALRRDLETAAVLNNLGVAQFRMRQPAAASLFEKAAFLPDHRQRDITFNRCLALIFDNKAEAALPSLDTTLKGDPSDVRTRLLRVWALRTLRRDEERIDEWNRLVSLAPSFSSLANPDLARKLERIFFSERNPQS